jgi:hypothetical protein
LRLSYQQKNYFISKATYQNTSKNPVHCNLDYSLTLSKKKGDFFLDPVVFQLKAAACISPKTDLILVKEEKITTLKKLKRDLKIIHKLKNCFI